MSATTPSTPIPSDLRVYSPSGRTFHSHRSILSAMREAMELGLNLVDGDTDEVLWEPGDHRGIPFQDEILEALKAEAARAHEAYPQYAGHWDGWELGQIAHDVKTKRGLAFQKGDLVLVNPRSMGFDFEVLAPLVAYSWRNRVDTAIAPWAVNMEILG